VGGCDIHAAFDSPTGLIYPAQDTGRLSIRTNATVHEVTVDPATGKARGVGFIDTVTGKSYEARAKAVVLAASTLESARLLLLSKSRQHPNGIGNSSGLVGHHFCEHLMGRTSPAS
jgi:choline dehydrogenase-like flavoprotein